MEQRKEERIAPKELEPVEVQIMGQGFLDILFAKDIGKNGLGLYAPNNYTCAKVQCEVELIISVPGHKSFEASGLITHTGNNAEQENPNCTCIGIHFTRITPQNKAILVSYFEKLLSDNRHHIRVEPSPEKPVQALAEFNEITENLPVRDISLGGVGIAAHRDSFIHRCSQDDEIRFIIKLPSGDTLPINGSLKYICEQSTLFGLRFQNLDREHSGILKKYIASRVKERQQKVDFS